NPPEVFTRVALQQLPDVIGFFRRDVPAAFASVKDEALLAEFKSSNGAVISELQKYEQFLHDDLLKASHGDFKLGPEAYSKKLLYEDMVDTPLDRLLEIGYADLHANQARLKEVAAGIDPKHSPREVLAKLEKDHPAPAQLLQTFRDVLGGLRQFIE